MGCGVRCRKFLGVHRDARVDRVARPLCDPRTVNPLYGDDSFVSMKLRYQRRGYGPKLRAPKMEDLPGLHALYADSRTWWNVPGGPYLEQERTEALLRSWIEDWKEHDLGYWAISDKSGAFIGVGGIKLCGGAWNVLCCIRTKYWHLGYATYAVRCALAVARCKNPKIPVFISTPANNYATLLIAERLGFTVIRRDVEPEDTSISRRIYADRPVTDEALINYLTARQTMPSLT